MISFIRKLSHKITHASLASQRGIALPMAMAGVAAAAMVTVGLVGQMKSSSEYILAKDVGAKIAAYNQAVLAYSLDNSVTIATGDTKTGITWLRTSACGGTASKEYLDCIRNVSLPDGLSFTTKFTSLNGKIIAKTTVGPWQRDGSLRRDLEGTAIKQSRVTAQASDVSSGSVVMTNFLQYSVATAAPYTMDATVVFESLQGGQCFPDGLTKVDPTTKVAYECIAGGWVLQNTMNIPEVQFKPDSTVTNGGTCPTIGATRVDSSGVFYSCVGNIWKAGGGGGGSPWVEDIPTNSVKLQTPSRDVTIGTVNFNSTLQVHGILTASELDTKKLALTPSNILAGQTCAQNGLQQADANGALLSCVAGHWANAKMTKHFQRFNVSGTFFPSAALLANGGMVELEMAGGGGGGSSVNGGGSSYLHTFTVVGGPVPVSIGAGGWGMNIAPAQNTTFGYVTAVGGGNATNIHAGSAGSHGEAGMSGYWTPSAGLVFAGSGGGSGGSAFVLGKDGTPNTGGGGGGTNVFGVPQRGRGGSGYCLVMWWE